MIPSHMIISDREQFQVVKGVDFEATMNDDGYSYDAGMTKSELLITTLHDRLDEWIDQFIFEVEI